ncbi:MAG: protein kinase domain-containing protein, partial [Gemmataceae bacterium]
MPAWKIWLWALGKAIWSEAPQAVVGLIPFGDNLYRVAERFHANLNAGQPPAQNHAALQQLIALPPQEVQEEAERVAEVVAPDATPDARRTLARTLTLAPDVSRRTLRRAEDPGGKTVPATLRLDQKGALVPFVPPGPPRFQAGESPAPLNGWKLVERLGAGGFAEVWKVCHPDDEHLVAAYKFFLADPARSRFGEHEVAVLKQVRRLGTSSATGIVKLEDFNVKTDPPWIRFECIDGGDLVAHAPGFYGPAATAFVLDLARIVGRCHRLTPSVVHRDIKPSNVLLRREGGRLVPLIADFGIGSTSAAAALNQERVATLHRATLPTELLGSHTALYASPEQRAGMPPSPRDDVYSLGVLWYQLLMGNLTLGAPSGNWTKKVAALGLSAELIELLGSCCDDERPADAAALAEALTSAMDQPGREPPTAAPAPPTSGRKPLGASQAEKQQAAREAHARARDYERVGDYAKAAAEIEPLEEHLQEPGYRKTLLDRAAEVAALDEEITRLDGEARLTWQHRPKILRWKELVPPMAVELDGLLAHLPDVPAQFTSPTLKMPMVLVPAGEFWMGGGDGKCGDRRVQMPEPFYLGTYPVTQGQWKALMGKNPNWFARGGGGA